MYTYIYISIYLSIYLSIYISIITIEHESSCNTELFYFAGNIILLHGKLSYLSAYKKKVINIFF